MPAAATVVKATAVGSAIYNGGPTGMATAPV